MKPWLISVTSRAMAQMISHAERVKLVNTDEFTFRSMFMHHAVDLHRGILFQTEWSKFDLLAQVDGQSTLIEFKYYMLRQNAAMDGTRGTFKGGAGSKNESEFWRCVEKLATAVPGGIAERFLVLIYMRDYERQSQHSFHQSYGAIAPGGYVTEVWPISEGALEGRVLKIAPGPPIVPRSF